jgi:hypothetical protein
MQNTDAKRTPLSLESVDNNNNGSKGTNYIARQKNKASAFNDLEKGYRLGE